MPKEIGKGKCRHCLKEFTYERKSTFQIKIVCSGCTHKFRNTFVSNMKSTYKEIYE